MNAADRLNRVLELIKSTEDPTLLHVLKYWLGDHTLDWGNDFGRRTIFLKGDLVVLDISKDGEEWVMASDHFHLGDRDDRYPTHAAAVEACKAWARENGFLTRKFGGEDECEY